MRGEKYLLFQLVCVVLLQLMVMPCQGQESDNESFTCKQLKNQNLSFTTSLCTEDNAYISEIVGIELLNCIMRRKFPIFKLNFDTDTLFKSVYRTSLINQDIDSLPDPVIRRVRDSQIKYLLIVYNFNSVREVSSKSKLQRPKYAHIPGEMSKSTDSGARPNRFASITCTVNLIDVDQNRSIFQKTLKADNTVCPNESIYCMVGKIIKSICEYKDSGESCKPCFKLR